ncbi:phosphonoacetaldehyde reductase [Roseovarius aestuarii]|nr:phosphonoacetaldehyde reductase [Roseovarius aestuarii]
MTPNYTSGIGSLSELPQLLKKYNAKKTLLVTGKASYAACGAAAVIDPIFEDGSVVRFSDFAVNPKIEDAERGTALARAEGVDLILAVGGGSPMDMAKLIKAFYADPSQSHALAKGELQMTDPGLPLIAVPTTAGSGSEATHFAVVYIGKDKYSLASQLLLPEEIILDGSLLASSTPYQRACNGLDALAQAIESAWAAGSTEESREYSWESIEKVMRHLPAVVAKSADDQAFQDMIVSANLAGRAINISKTTAAHAWAYGLTGHHDVPHGHAVWLTLPEIVGIHAAATDDQITDPRGPAHVRAIMDRLLPMLNAGSPDEATQVLRDFMIKIGTEPDMEKLGADTPEQRRFLSQQVNMQRMSNNPVGLDDTAMSRIFRI